MFSSKFSITAASIILLISLILSSTVLAQTTPPTQTNPGYNETLNPQFLVWDAGLRAVGFYIKPSISFNLTGIQTNFNSVQQSGSQDRDVTIELFTDRPAVGGTVLRTATFNSSSARGRLGGVTFAPLVLSAGTRYFVGFRNIAGIGINTTTDAGAVNCGAFQGIQFGAAGDQPAPTDFDGDGRSDIAVFRPSNGTWYYLRSSNGSFGAAQFGANGDIPISGIR